MKDVGELRNIFLNHYESFNRNQVALLILMVFIVGTTSFYLVFQPGMDAEISHLDKYLLNESGYQKVYEINVTNNEDNAIEPRFWVIKPYSSEELAYSENISIEPGETKTMNISIDVEDDSLRFGKRYQVLLEDKKTGERYVQPLNLNIANSGKNPHFVHSYNHKFHWSGSIYGTGFYNINTAGRGLNADFKGCDESPGCGFTYRDDYKLVEKVKVTGIGYNITNTNLTVTIENKDKEVDLPVNISNGRFKQTIDVEKYYNETGIKFERGRDVVYELSYETRKREDHKIYIDEFDFISSNKPLCGFIERIIGCEVN